MEGSAKLNLGAENILMRQQEQQTSTVEQGNVSNQTLLNMMINLQKSVNSLKGEIVECKTGSNLKVQNIEQTQNEDDDRTLDLYEKQEQSDDKITFLTGVVARQEKVIQGLKDRIVEIERNRMINNLIITGIPQREHENCQMESQNFFRSKLPLDHDMPVRTARRLGKGVNRPMLMELHDHWRI